MISNNILFSGFFLASHAFNFRTKTLVATKLKSQLEEFEQNQEKMQEEITLGPVRDLHAAYNKSFGILSGDIQVFIPPFPRKWYSPRRGIFKERPTYRSIDSGCTRVMFMMLPGEMGGRMWHPLGL